jgi:hypothetical protein
MAGQAPEHPISVAELERRVAETAEPRAVAYVLGGAGSEQTMRSNLEAFRRWRLVPRMLRDVSERDLTVTVANTRMPAPVALAPIGVQSIVHPDGELAVDRIGVSARGDRRRRRGAEVVSALLAARPGADGKPRRARRARRL